MHNNYSTKFFIPCNQSIHDCLRDQFTDHTNLCYYFNWVIFSLQFVYQLLLTSFHRKLIKIQHDCQSVMSILIFLPYISYWSPRYIFSYIYLISMIYTYSYLYKFVNLKKCTNLHNSNALGVHVQCFQLKEATRWFLNIVYIICCKKVIMQA